MLTESVGLDPADVFALILGTRFPGRAYEIESVQITERSFEPGFKAKLALEDMRRATEASNQIGRTLPMLEAVREGLSKAVSAGLGEKDWSITADMTVRGGDSRASSENNPEKK
ncbi:2-hydroxy-3-oxopropionate reductase [Methylobacterium crusticola]|uniref:2-hydroxy-3-oxopropionate reductase n=1 Tax=Methylobacterium crusticola TaxID=1697972 RepID=A0ABQ4R8P0_9HYPH|nr:2-hydroxy-3-oxopropionate reductase [Methylobacterium crusticola]